MATKTKDPQGAIPTTDTEIGGFPRKRIGLMLKIVRDEALCHEGQDTPIAPSYKGMAEKIGYSVGFLNDVYLGQPYVLRESLDNALGRLGFKGKTLEERLVALSMLTANYIDAKERDIQYVEALEGIMEAGKLVGQVSAALQSIYPMEADEKIPDAFFTRFDGVTRDVLRASYNGVPQGAVKIAHLLRMFDKKSPDAALTALAEESRAVLEEQHKAHQAFLDGLKPTPPSPYRNSFAILRGIGILESMIEEPANGPIGMYKGDAIERPEKAPEPDYTVAVRALRNVVERLLGAAESDERKYIENHVQFVDEEIVLNVTRKGSETVTVPGVHIKPALLSRIHPDDVWEEIARLQALDGGYPKTKATPDVLFLNDHPSLSRGIDAQARGMGLKK